MIKLLKKEEIAFQKSREKAQEVAEGLKISRRVDALRQLQAKEESSVNEWRDKTVVQITKEIDVLLKKRETLESKVKDLEERLSKMSPELATTRKALENLKKQLEAKEKELKDKEHSVNLQEIDISIARKEAENSFAQAKTREKASLELHMSAESAHFQADETLKRANQIESNILKLKQDTEEALTLRELGIKDKELTLKAQEESNLAKERALAVEKIQLADREKTLERELQRLRKNRLGNV